MEDILNGKHKYEIGDIVEYHYTNRFRSPDESKTELVEHVQTAILKGMIRGRVVGGDYIISLEIPMRGRFTRDAQDIQEGDIIKLIKEHTWKI